MTETVPADAPEREEKAVSDLERGTWIQLIDEDGEDRGEVEVLHVETYPDRWGGKSSTLMYRLQGGNPETLLLDSRTTMPLLSAERLTERREQAERAQKIAGIRALADWLEANPQLPVGHARMQTSEDPHGNVWEGGAEGVAEVRRLAESIGAKVDDSGDDRTEFSVFFGDAEYKHLSWHQSGRPVEPDAQQFLDAMHASADKVRQAFVDPTGLAYTRVDDEPGDPTPVSGARVEPHVGAMTDEGLVDETPVEPVTVYFSFGHGQTDPDTGKSLLDRYVTIVGPSHEACRQAMFASKYGARWAFDYLKGDPESDEWIARWTEHERIDAMPKTDL